MYFQASDHGRQDEQNQLFPSKRGKTTKATNATKALKVEEDFVNGDALFGEAAKSRKMKRKMKKCQNHEVSIPGLKDPGKRRAPRRVCQKKTSKKRQRVQLAAKAAEVFHAKGGRVHERKKGNFQVLSRRRMALPPMEVEMGPSNMIVSFHGRGSFPLNHDYGERVAQLCYSFGNGFSYLLHFALETGTLLLLCRFLVVLGAMRNMTWDSLHCEKLVQLLGCSSQHDAKVASILAL